MNTINTYEIARFIISNLHTLTETRPLIVPRSDMTITRADFERVADGMTLGEALSSPADMEWIAFRLALVAMTRHEERVDAPMIFVVVNSPPKPYLTVSKRAIIVYARNGVYEVCDCTADDGIRIKWVRKCVTRAEALVIARDWVRHYQS